MNIGIYPYQNAIDYDAQYSRRVAYASTFRSGVPDVRNVLLNIDASPFHTLTKNYSRFAEEVYLIYSKLRPRIICIENEELLMDGNFDDYIGELKAASQAIGGRVTNGGLTLPELSYWYLSINEWDVDFFRDNIIQKADYQNGLKQPDIDKVQLEIDAIISMQLKFVNVHYYIAREEQVAGLIRMFNYLAQYTGARLISNEAGIYTTGLLQSVVDVALQCDMKFLILYSGTGESGTGKSLPISKDDFLNLKTRLY